MVSGGEWEEVRRSPDSYARKSLNHPEREGEPQISEQIRDIAYFRALRLVSTGGRE